MSAQARGSLSRRNRITYNVQDLFVGSVANEWDSYVTGIYGHQILKRLNRIQSISYDISPGDRAEIAIIGKGHNIHNIPASPTEINFSFSYILHGVNNEHRMGFNVDHQYYHQPITQDYWNTSTQLQGIRSTAPYFVRDFIEPYSSIGGATIDAVLGLIGDANRGHSNNSDRRNYYLVINNNDENDIRKRYDDPPLSISSGSSNQMVQVITDPDSTGYGVLCFQNCYVTSYGASITVGDIPKANVNLIADNLIYHISGSGVHIPEFEAVSGVEKERSEKFIIPKAYKDEDDVFVDVMSAFEPGDITVTIDSSPDESGFYHHKQTIQSFDMSIELTRENIHYLPWKHYYNRPVTLPTKAGVDIGFLSTMSNSGEFFSGSLVNSAKRNATYDIVVEASRTMRNGSEQGLRYGISGAKLDSTSETAGVGANNLTTMSFSVDMDEQNFTKGIFVSGFVAESTGLALHEGSTVTWGDANSPITCFGFVPM